MHDQKNPTKQTSKKFNLYKKKLKKYKIKNKKLSGQLSELEMKRLKNNKSYVLKEKIDRVHQLRRKNQNPKFYIPRKERERERDKTQTQYFLSYVMSFESSSE